MDFHFILKEKNANYLISVCNLEGLGMFGSEPEPYISHTKNAIYNTFNLFANEQKSEKKNLNMKHGNKQKSVVCYEMH